MIYNSKNNTYGMIINPPRHPETVIKKTLNTDYVPSKLMDVDNSHIIWIKNKTKSDGSIYGITIDNVYMSNKLYADGSRKISNEFNISFQNFIDGLNEFDIMIMLQYSKYKDCQISEFYKMYHKTPKTSKDIQTNEVQ